MIQLVLAVWPVIALVGIIAIAVVLAGMFGHLPSQQKSWRIRSVVWNDDLDALVLVVSCTHGKIAVLEQYITEDGRTFVNRETGQRPEAWMESWMSGPALLALGDRRRNIARNTRLGL